MAQESVLRIVIDSRNAERNARNVANELQNIERNGDHASRSMDSMSVATRQLAGYMAGIVTIGAAINKMDAYTGINNKLKLVTTSQTELNQAMQDTFAIAQRSASSWSAVNDVYSKYMSNAKTLNLTQAQTARLTEITSKAVALSGSSAESAAGALFQYGQALDGGILRAEEYNSLVDGAGGLLSAMAKGLNVTRGELRQMMLDGKLTGEVITKALMKAGDSVDELFNKTDVTIGQSLTVLSDSVTKFVGEASSGSGAATVLAGSIRVLADNLDLIADGTIVLGIGYITTAIATKTLAVKADIAATLAQRAATQAQAIEEVKLATAIVNDAKAHLASTQATAAATQAKFGATAAATKYKMATDAVTQAIIRQEAAEKAAYGSTMNMSKASAGLLGFLGGPVGIGLTLATVAAGYMLMRDNAEKATASIDTQGQSVDDLIVKYRELNTLQRDNETKALADQVEDLSLKFRVASSDLTSFMQALPVSDDKITTWSKLHSEFSQGRINSVQYYESIKALNILNDDQLNKVRGLIGGYDSSNTKMKEAEVAQKALASSAKKTTQEAKDQAVSVANLSEKIKELLKSSSQNITDSKITSALASRGYNDTMIELLKKYLAVEGAIVKNEEGRQVLRADLQKMLKAEYDAIMKAKGAVDSRNEAEKERTKELEKQQKVLQASSKVQANAAKYNFSGLESKYSLPNGMLSALHAIETGNTGKTNQVNKQSGATGGFQFLKGTADQYGVKDRTDMAQSAEGAAKYMSYLLKLFKGDLEKAVRAYHAGEGNVQKGKNIGKYNNDYWQKFKGYTAGENGFTGGDVGAKEWEKQLEEATRLLEEQAELRKNLEFDVASEVTKIRENLKDKLEEIDKAGYSPERAQELKGEYQARADNDIAIAQQALKTKLDDYGAFKKTESQLLEDSFNERKFYASRDLELTKEQRQKAVALLESQYQQELGYIKLAQETQLFQAKQAYMHEVDLMQERYRLEMQEIDKIADVKQRAAMREATAAKYVDDYEKKRKTAQDNLDSLAADLTGQTELYALQKQMEDREAILDEARKYGLIKEEEYKAALLQIEEDYKNAKLNLQLDQAQQVTGALSGMFSAMLGESSSAYRALYEAQRSFALAQAGINIWKSASDAYANEPGTVWQKIGAAAKATLDQGTFVAMIQAATPKGFETGGYTGSGGRKDVAGVVHGQEYVLNAAATKRVGVGTLDAINSGKSVGGGGGGDVHISQTIVVNTDGSAKVDTEGQKQLAQGFQAMMEAYTRKEMRQGGSIYNFVRGRK